MKKCAVILSIVCNFVCTMVCAQCTFTSSVPYYESFSGVVVDNQLPNCWNSTNLGTATLTFSNNVNAFTGQRCAAFFHLPSGTNYFYSNGIQLYSGVTYSCGLHFKTDNTGGTNWSNLAILLGPSQSSTGASVIASTNSPNTPNFTALSGTFTVSSSNIYYLVIRGTGASGLAESLFFDNISITIPCTGVGATNSPTIQISTNNGFTTTAGSSSFCASPQNTFIASGAGSYTWANGSNSSVFISTSTLSSMVSVSGTNTLTGCVSSASISSIYPTPNLTLGANSYTICPSETVTLSVNGANTYSWSNGSTSSVAIVSPTTTTSYSVKGTFTNTGCSSNYTVQVMVAPVSLSLSANPTSMCSGSTASISASGANNYQWIGLAANSSSISVTPSVTTAYTVIGSNSPLCTDTATITINILPSPALGIQGNKSICIGETIVLTGTGASTYQWNGPALVAAGNAATVNPVSSAAYTIIGQGSNSCSSKIVWQLNVLECVGLNTFQNQPLNLYPNPFAGVFQIAGLLPGDNIQILDAEGQKVDFMLYEANYVDLVQAKAGLYVLLIDRGEYRISYRILKCQD